jgi:DNA-binding MarR family transcriptional regulator
MSDKTQFSQITHKWMDISMQRSWRAWNHLAKSSGLSMPQFSILMKIYHRGDCAIGDISEHFDITNAAASQLVDKLVQGGLIRRDESPHDRRAKILNLTEKGTKFIQKGIEERYRWVDQLAGKLTPEERLKVVEALQIMTQAAKELETETTTHVHA